MKRGFGIYQYLAPSVLAPLSLVLWYREYGGDWRLIAAAWLVPVAWAYVVPGIGTNVLKVWEFDTRLRLGRFRPHHGFVFGSATAMIAWIVHTGPAVHFVGALGYGMVNGWSTLGFVLGRGLRSFLAAWLPGSTTSKNLSRPAWLASTRPS